MLKHIAVGIDFSDAKEPVLEAGAELAKGLGAVLHVFHVVAPEPAFVGYTAYAYPGADERDQELAAEKVELQGVIDRLRAEGVDAHAYMKPGETIKSLLEFAEARDACLLVVGTHSRNLFSRVLLGSTAEGLVRHSKIPVVVVPVKRGAAD